MACSSDLRERYFCPSLSSPPKNSRLSSKTPSRSRRTSCAICPSASKDTSATAWAETGTSQSWLQRPRIERSSTACATSTTWGDAPAPRRRAQAVEHPPHGERRVRQPLGLRTPSRRQAAVRGLARRECRARRCGRRGEHAAAAAGLHATPLARGPHAPTWARFATDPASGYIRTSTPLRIDRHATPTYPLPALADPVEHAPCRSTRPTTPTRRTTSC